MGEKYRKILAEITESTAVAQDTDLLPSGFKQVRPDSLVRISIAANAVVVGLVSDEGSTVFLNAGTALALDGIYTEEIHLDSSRTWNVRTADVAGLTAKLFTVVEVNE